MIHKLKSLLGYKEYLVEITWDNGEREIVLMKAFSPINAIKKVAKTKDVVNKAEMTVLNQSKISKVRYCRSESLGVATQKKYFTTIGLHDGYFEMEILVDSSAETKEQSKKLGNSDKFHIGYLYEDKLVIKGEILTIKKEETDKYQFRVCKEWKPIVSDEDYEDLTWDEAVKYLMEEENRTLPFMLESYFFGTFETHPFASRQKKTEIKKMHMNTT